MPQINRIRVNNVKYNFGTQFYDDFVMRFSCKNTIYDLANGGGKSVLMLLLLQNLIPNCTLDEKQPVEKLFRTGSGSNTIHSLIEWKLDNENIKNNYKYMLTGFCARKAKDDGQEENGENASIEYFNYCIFYREFNDNDLKNLPLSNGNERITYNGLKAYLRELERKDFSLEVKIFDRKGEYQRFIAQYGLYESQWEIIRGINKTEGHVRTYFETNYKTTRNVVEDLLIEEIIEKSFNTRVAADDSGNGANVMAKTLLDIKDKLIELSGKKEDINSFDRQIEAIESFIGRISGIRQLYFGRDELEGQIVKSYNTLNKIMADRDRALEEFAAKAEELQKEKASISKKIDTIRVQKTEEEMLEITALIDELSEKLNLENEEYRKKKSELLMMESENDYMDYLYYKAERDSIKAVIDSMVKGDVESEDAKLKLAAMGNERKRRNQKKKTVLTKEIEKEQEILEKESLVIVENEEKENAYIQDISVAEYLSSDYEKKLSEINEAIYKEKESLNMIMSPDMSEEQQKLSTQIRLLTQKLETLNNEMIEAARSGREIEYEYADAQLNLKRIEDDINRLFSERENDESLKKKLEKMEELYGEKNTDRLVEMVGERYREQISESAVTNEKLTSLKRYAVNLEKGCPVGDSAEVSEVLKYIEKYHGNVAVSGSEYLAGLLQEEKKEIIERIPVLPYSIVIKNSYETIISDRGLKRILSGDYAVPLIKLEAAKGSGYLFDVSGVSFVMRDDSLFTDKEAVAKELEKTLEAIRDMEDKKSRLDETEVILREDYDFIKEYRDIYKERLLQNEREYDEKRLMQKQLMAEIEAVNTRRLELAEQTDELKNCENRLKSEILVCEEKEKQIVHIISLDKEAAATEQSIRQLKSKKEILKREYGKLSARIKASKDSMKFRESHIKAIREELTQIDKSWDDIYKVYYKEMEDISPYGLDILSDEELDAKAKALKEIISGALNDIKDKQKLMENYDVAMEKSLQAIDYKGVSLEEIKERYKSGVMKQYKKEELISFKQLLDGVEKSIKQMEAELVKNRTSRDRLEGAVNHGMEAIEEKYGRFDRLKEDALSFDRILEESKNSISAVDIILAELKAKQDEIQNTSKEYIIYKRDLDKIIESINITNIDENNIWEDSIDFKEKIAAVSEKYEKFRKETVSRKEELEYEKNTLAQTLNAMSSYQLAEEIRTNIHMPESIAETEELMENLKEITECLKLEKERVEKSIEDMERIKDNFENQCIQSCVNIKTELERLPKLSKIYMDGESISIIGLSIPYIKEEAYKQHMSRYIDNIVESADNLKSEEERIKYIRKQLAWKKLFSVIVTDMNAIKLTLYKRERIKEQSRYLRYEEAVGSTGQSQGIYIQFLIGIINYITSINSGNSESGNLGKVVFIDNPFGAAKDVYIWEPIFKMLKTNNVQLIVPCRGATPAITGRFDVNYILGQKMTDGKQQTVVVEYYSNVESDSVEYEKLSFEQNSLIFD